MTDLPDDPLWRYTLAIYGREGVSPALIALQDRHDVKVNVLLYCLWLGSERRVLAGDGVAAARAAAEGWNEAVIKPLREARRAMKAGLPSVSPDITGAVRKALQKVELDCEHIEQLALGALELDRIAPVSDRAPEAAAAANVASYLRALGIPLQGEDRPHIVAILAGAFSVTPEQAEAALAAAG